mmetsp:Transcript_31056/g.65433  ORF Transcript_31056/g.65433 Transcript_31056/m.65433 type:complete len:209 (-) Transcript_31056:924-1550(-)
MPRMSTRALSRAETTGISARRRQSSAATSRGSLPLTFSSSASSIEADTPRSRTCASSRCRASESGCSSSRAAVSTASSSSYLRRSGDEARSSPNGSSAGSSTRRSGGGGADNARCRESRTVASIKRAASKRSKSCTGEPLAENKRSTICTASVSSCCSLSASSPPLEAAKDCSPSKRRKKRFESITCGARCGGASPIRCARAAVGALV